MVNKQREKLSDSSSSHDSDKAENLHENYKSALNDSLVYELTYCMHYGMMKRWILKRCESPTQRHYNSFEIEIFLKKTKEDIEEMNKKKLNKKK